MLSSVLSSYSFFFCFSFSDRGSNFTGLESPKATDFFYSTYSIISCYFLSVVLAFDFFKCSILTVTLYWSGSYCLTLNIYWLINYYQFNLLKWSTVNIFFNKLITSSLGLKPPIFPPLGNMSFLMICSYISTLFMG